MPALVSHVFLALLIGISYITFSLLIVYFLDLSVISGLGMAFSIFGVFIAALISTSSYYPVAKSSKVRHVPLFFKTHFGLMLLTSAVAFLSSLGGGMVRRAITGGDILPAPESYLWAALVVGWMFAFYLSYFEMNICKKKNLFQRFSVSLDSWALGVFGVAGMLAALEWLSLDGRQANFYVQLFASAAFSALTGAGGGLVAGIFAKLTIEYERALDIFTSIHKWLFARYTQIGFWIGTSSFIFLKSIPFVIPVSTLTKFEFNEADIGLRQLLINTMNSKDFNVLSKVLPNFASNYGIIVLIYIIFGFLSAYMYRSAKFCELDIPGEEY